MSVADVEPLRRSIRPLELTREITKPDQDRPMPNLSEIALKLFGPSDTKTDGKNLGTSPRNFDAAFLVLRQSADCLEKLRAERDRLQGDLQAEQQSRKLDLEAFRFEKAQWQKTKAALDEEWLSSQTQLGKAVELVGILHDRLSHEGQKAAAESQRTQMLEQIAMSFHDSILESLRNDMAGKVDKAPAAKIERLMRPVAPEKAKVERQEQLSAATS